MNKTAGLSMELSRRRFIGSATASAGSLWMSRLPGLPSGCFLSEGRPNCLIVDLGFHCVLAESLQGYRAALAGTHTYATDLSGTQESCGLAIVPAIGSMDDTTAHSLFALLQSGTRVLLESGAAFWTLSEFVVHQQLMHCCFGIEVEPPVDLWSGHSQDLSSQVTEQRRRRGTQQEKSIPYVE